MPTRWLEAEAQSAFTIRVVRVLGWGRTDRGYFTAESALTMMQIKNITRAELSVFTLWRTAPG